MLIASAKGNLSLKLNISVQTGLRPVEVTGEPKGLKAKDLHTDTNTITPTSAKGCNARPPIKITPELTTRLQTHIIKHNLKPNDRLFKEKPKSYTSNYCKMRNNLADKTGDQSIRAIRLYDLRHAYITKLLRKIQNAEIVRQKVGHKRLNTTQKYIHLTADENGEYIVESTTDQKRADELLTQGFTYCLTTPDGYMKFRKPK
jgi:integrase